MIAVKDSFYVVPIRVEDECGVVLGVIVRSQPGSSVVDPSCLDGCGVERINRFAVWRGERNVHRKRSSSDLLALLSAVETCIAANDIRSVRIELDGQKYTLAAQ